MSWLANILSSVQAAGAILAAMVLVAVIEAVIPLRARGRWHRDHLAPNLALTLLTFGTNVFLNAALVTALLWLEAHDAGALRMLGLPVLVEAVVVVVALDLTFWMAHVAMHKVPALWRFHAVHHCDPALDVTTTIRQHPGESVIRYAGMGAVAIALGASPAGFAAYRLLSALNGLLEHANLRVWSRLDTALSLLVVTPNMHKVHHSRVAAETDTNYSNLFSAFDRLFGTFTPSRRGRAISYGLDGLDDPRTQTTAGLLALPFRLREKETRLPARVRERRSDGRAGLGRA
jgi:sterol desaturase/sphingolipid hydroxylase (fatty acid hydroxylase superfamily)